MRQTVTTWSSFLGSLSYLFKLYCVLSNIVDQFFYSWSWYRDSPHSRKHMWGIMISKTRFTVGTIIGNGILEQTDSKIFVQYCLNVIWNYKWKWNPRTNWEQEHYSLLLKCNGTFNSSTYYFKLNSVALGKVHKRIHDLYYHHIWFWISNTMIYGGAFIVDSLTYWILSLMLCGPIWFLP